MEHQEDTLVLPQVSDEDISTESSNNLEQESKRPRLHDKSWMKEMYQNQPNDDGIEAIPVRRNCWIELPIMEVEGAVLFPGQTIPIRFQNRPWIRYVQKLQQPNDGKKEAAKIHFGILCSLVDDDDMFDELHRPQLNVLRQQRQADARYRAEDSNDSTRQPKDHPLIGRIGTIATMTTSQIQFLDDEEEGGNIDEELFLTCVGTSRFVVVACVDDPLYSSSTHPWRSSRGGAIRIFKVEEIVDSPLSIPRSIGYATKTTININHSDDKRDNDNDKYSQVFHKDDWLIHNLSQMTPFSHTVYANHWPWKLVTKIRMLIETTPAFVGLQKLLPPLDKNDTSDMQEDLSSSADAAPSHDDNIVQPLLNHSFQATSHDSVLEPISFSFWMASNMTLNVESKCQILAMISSTERLKFILRMLQQQATAQSMIYCQSCKSPLSQVHCIFTLSGQEGTTQNNVNPHGIIHQTTTLRRVFRGTIQLYGRASTYNSYFPGYSWTCMSCSICREHLGWKFILVDQQQDASEERPSYFYGMCAGSVCVGLDLE